MGPQDHPQVSELAAEIIAADRSSRPVPEEPAPVGLAFTALGLLPDPFSRRHREALLQ